MSLTPLKESVSDDINAILCYNKKRFCYNTDPPENRAVICVSFSAKPDFDGVNSKTKL